MAGLSETVEEVRRRILIYQGKDINEQNTKTALIDPVLRVLSWDVGNLEEVCQEYKRKPQDKPVDYALLLLRTPKLFVEAKALGQNLDDRRWASQIMGYAAVAGAKWTVLTNGDEYRIYNACVDVPVEEKLFRTVRITEVQSRAEETLRLLSKERIRDNDIEILWKAHFVDRQVRVALEELFTPEIDGSLTRLVKKRVTELSLKDIRASLTRVRVRFDFPVEPETSLPQNGKRRKSVAAMPNMRSDAAKKAWETRRKENAFVRTSIKDVIAVGLLKAPLKLTKRYKSRDLEADLLLDGTVTFQGKNYRTCSEAAQSARSTVTGRQMNTNGWRFWNYVDAKGNLNRLDVARQNYLKRKAK